MMMRASFSRVLFVIFVLTVWPLSADAGITLNPSRVIFNEGTREAEVLLFNRANSPATYRISTRTFRMTPDGKFDAIADADMTNSESLAKKMIRFSPRLVELQPNQAQRVRLMVRRPSNLPPGEYLAFLRLEEVPRSQPAPSTIDGEGKKKVGLAISALYAVSIPVIIRQGQVDPSVRISNVRLENTPTGKALQFDVSRAGLHSVYGDFQVHYSPGKERASHLVGELNGVSILPPITTRKVSVRLKPPEKKVLGKGRYEVRFTDFEASKGSLLAEGKLLVR